LGLFCDPNLEIRLFKDSNHEKVLQARELVDKRKVEVSVVVDTDKKFADIDILTKVKIRENNKCHTGLARIQHAHSNITYIERDGRVLYQKESKIEEEINQDSKELSTMSISDMLHLVETLSDDDKKFIAYGITMNEHASEVGLDKKLGLGIGYNLERLIKERTLSYDMINQAKIKAASGVDARMSGYDVSVMATSGSGNQGLTAILPIVAVAEELGRDEEKLIKAVTLSHLITAYISYYSGELSAFCGCGAKAGIGATSGIVYYLGGNEEKINDAINNMAASIPGMICDGAKVGCAEKISLAAETAVQSALLAMKGVKVPSDNGIVAERAEDTMRNIGKVSEGMTSTDKYIVEIMESKS